MEDHGQFRKRLRGLGILWWRYRNSGIRALLLTLLLLLVLAQVYPPLQAFVLSQQSLGAAVAVAMMYLLFDAIVSPPPDSRIDRSVVLRHFTDLRSHLRHTFNQAVIELDIAAYSGETFYNVLTEFLQEVVEGRSRPRRLRLRMIVPDCTAPMAVPCDLRTLQEHPGYKKAVQERNRRFATEFAHYFSDIARRFPQMEVGLSIRLHRFSPVFKMIMINQRTVFFGFYPISETPVYSGDERIEMWDYRGERATMVGLSLVGTGGESELARQVSEWFGSVWGSLSETVQEV